MWYDLLILKQKQGKDLFRILKYCGIVICSDQVKELAIKINKIPKKNQDTFA